MKEESKRPRNALVSSIQVMNRSNEAAESLEAECRHYPFAVGSALPAVQEQLVEKGKATPNSTTTSNPGLEGSLHLVAISRVCTGGNGTTLPGEVQRSSGERCDAYDPDIENTKEGNGVASGLKWALLSQSVVLMPPPKHTSWDMEKLLEPLVR
jgi:hypothetical protein